MGVKYRNLTIKANDCMARGPHQSYKQQYINQMGRRERKAEGNSEERANKVLGEKRKKG